MSISFESFGKYVLLEKLATGGMAEVFLGRGTGTGGIGKFFAIKRILPQYADSPEFIEMFKAEAKIAINLNHSNIVSIHEFGIEKGIFYLVMDYVEGRNLRQILNKMKKSSLQFSMDQIVYMLKETAAGLDHAHRCLDGTTGKPLNITHRDMSPQNLMVSFEGEVKIVDFGIAKAESQIETTRAGTLKGKFGYMSPEQAEGQPVDLRTDIFSLGIVIWELLANDRLFVANNEINTLRKIRDCQVPSLRKINPNIHTELERIVQKALARDRNLRYQTAAALHRDLNRFLNRQYPDFSPQDFAVFIKSVFSDEIMALRKRLVEYSKVNLTVSLNVPSGTQPGEKNFDDRTSLLNTDTNSLVVAGTEASYNASISNQGQGTGSDIAFGRPHTNDSNPDIAMPGEPNTITASNGPNTLELSNSKTGPQTLPPAGRTLAPQNSVLDEKALNEEMKREFPAAKAKMPLHSANLETEEVSSPSIRQQTRSYNASRSKRASSSSSSSSSSRKRSGSPMRFATFMVFAVLCLSIYAYLVKYFTPMMSEVIAVTDPYIHPIHVALNVDPHATLMSSHEPQSTAPPIHATPPPVQNSEVPPPAEEESSQNMVIISNPSGAEILINDKNTGLVTPSRVLVPAGKFNITLQKTGYAPSRLNELSKESVGHRLMVALVKLNVAYIDIDVFPPQDAVIMINGKKLRNRRGTIRQYAVPANTSVKIRAENLNGTAYDEVQINLPVDRRQTVQLNPRKPIRLPSSND